MNPKLVVNILGRQEETYYVFVLLGILAALLWMLGISFQAQYHTGFLLLLFGSYLFGSYSFNVIRSFIYKHPENTLYHHFLLLIIITWILCFFTERSIPKYLDIYAVAFSLSSAFGRQGCYHAGCCHGRKWKWGLKYPAEYEKYLKSKRLINTSLFPSQQLESIIHIVHFLLGTYFVLVDASPGFVFCLLTMSYAFCRFFLEFFRGDRRNAFLSISEAQWTSLAILLVLLIETHSNDLLYLSLIVLVSVESSIVLGQISNYYIKHKSNQTT